MWLFKDKFKGSLRWPSFWGLAFLTFSLWTFLWMIDIDWIPSLKSDAILREEILIEPFKEQEVGQKPYFTFEPLS